MTYSYDAAKGNMLYRVEDAVPNTTATSYDFEETEGIHGQEYFYDHNGNLWMDMNKGIVITYNYLNLPVEVKWNPSTSKRIEWMYDATGNKLRKTVYSATGEATNIINYANGFVYTGNFDNPMPELSFFPMSEGRVLSLGNTRYALQYMLKDHLGNTRVVFDNNNGTPSFVQTELYYPFGMTVTDWVNGAENKFKYNGKELEDEHGLNWYHYGVRYYDPQLGRWHTMDPADEFHSPYLYVGNNPVKYIDPNGAQVGWTQFVTDITSDISLSLTLASSKFWSGITNKVETALTSSNNSDLKKNFKLCNNNLSEGMYMNISYGKQSSFNQIIGESSSTFMHGGLTFTNNDIYVTGGLDFVPNLPLYNIPNVSASIGYSRKIEGTAHMFTFGAFGIGIEASMDGYFSGLGYTGFSTGGVVLNPSSVIWGGYYFSGTKSLSH